MSQLAQLRQKIRSIQTTKKITHAVRLISMSFYNKLERAHDPLRQYSDAIRDLFSYVQMRGGVWYNPVLCPRDVLDSSPLYIVVATTKGLCASLNSNLFRYLEQALFIDKNQKPVFIAIGQKAINYLRESNHGELVATYSDIDSNNFIALADDLIEKILHSSVVYSSVSVFSNEARSFFLQKPSKSTIIPLPVTNTTGVEAMEDSDEVIWEQPQNEVMDDLALRYLRSRMIYLFFQAISAEHAARFMAMENSTNNAEKYLERLTLQFNKLRQSLITKEISELSSGLPQR